MTQDDRMETITDPALIRATDEPDERGDFPCCTTPAPASGAGLDLDAARAMLNAANTIKATGGAVEIGGVRIEPCDEYGSTVTTARAESAEAEVVTLRANWRHVTKSLGYGDGVTEPQIGHVEFVAECERQFSEASEWRESQRWRDECHDAGHPDDEDCYEHDPVLALVALRAKVAAVEALADQWADRKRSDGMSGNAWIGITLAGVAADLRAALATTGEGQ